MRSVLLWLLMFPSVIVIGQAPISNQAPIVSMAWPRDETAVVQGVWVKLKAQAVDPDGSIAQVQFYAGSNLLGTVRSPPFNFIVGIDGPGPGGTYQLKAVATDNQGAKAETIPVRLYYITGPSAFPILEITSPRSRELFGAPASFEFTAELMALEGGQTGPVDFYIGTNLVGHLDGGQPFTATTPPYSVMVTNLSEGNYELRTSYEGHDGFPFCKCLPITISVVKLGVQFPTTTADGRPQFEVVTSFPGKPTVIQASTNLVDWMPVSTNVPTGNGFIFTATAPITGPSFYRVSVPP